MSKTIENKVAVFGGGPAAVGAIDGLSKAGMDVVQILPEEMNFSKRPVYTTSAGVYREVMDRFVPESLRRNLSKMRVITSTGTDFVVDMGENPYFLANYPGFIELWQRQFQKDPKVDTRSHPATALKELIIQEIKGGVEVKIDGKSTNYTAVVDSSGIQRRITRRVEPKEKDVLVEYIYAGSFPGFIDADEIILVWDETGGTSWLNTSPYIGENGEPMVDIAYSAWGWNSHFSKFTSEGPTRLAKLVEFVSKKPGIRILSPIPTHTVSGRIRSHPGSKPSSKRVFPAGEAAGVAKPKSGESFNRALLHGSMIAEAISRGETPVDVYDKSKKLWSNDEHFFAFTLARLRHQMEATNGQMMDEIGKWFASGRVNGEFVKMMEMFIIEGKLAPQLIKYFVTNPVFMKLLFETMTAHLWVKTFGVGSYQKWSLAPISSETMELVG